MYLLFFTDEDDKMNEKVIENKYFLIPAVKFDSTCLHEHEKNVYPAKYVKTSRGKMQLVDIFVGLFKHILHFALQSKE